MSLYWPNLHFRKCNTQNDSRFGKCFVIKQLGEYKKLLFRKTYVQTIK